MKISYDREVDALSITFAETTVTTKHLAEGIAADFDRDGRLVGLEIECASGVLTPEALDDLDAGYVIDALPETVDPAHACEDMLRALRADDLPVDYNARFREFGIPYLDGGSSLQLITHCPWCGVRLPLSLRDKWFGELESLGYQPDLFDVSNVPTKYLTDEWWKQS